MQRKTDVLNFSLEIELSASHHWLFGESKEVNILSQVHIFPPLAALSFFYCAQGSSALKHIHWGCPSGILLWLHATVILRSRLLHVSWCVFLCQRKAFSHPYSLKRQHDQRGTAKGVEMGSQCLKEKWFLLRKESGHTETEGQLSEGSHGKHGFHLHRASSCRLGSAFLLAWGRCTEVPWFSSGTVSALSCCSRATLSWQFPGVMLWLVGVSQHPLLCAGEPSCRAAF